MHFPTAISCTPELTVHSYQSVTAPVIRLIKLKLEAISLIFKEIKTLSFIFVGFEPGMYLSQSREDFLVTVSIRTSAMLCSLYYWLSVCLLCHVFLHDGVVCSLDFAFVKTVCLLLNAVTFTLIIFCTSHSTHTDKSLTIQIIPPYY